MEASTQNFKDQVGSRIHVKRNDECSLFCFSTTLHCLSPQQRKASLPKAAVTSRTSFHLLASFTTTALYILSCMHMLNQILYLSPQVAFHVAIHMSPPPAVPLWSVESYSQTMEAVIRVESTGRIPDNTTCNSFIHDNVYHADTPLSSEGIGKASTSNTKGHILGYGMA